MSTLIETNVENRVFPERSVLRKNLIEKLDNLPDEGMAVLYDMILELEMRAAWNEFSTGMAEDWAAGKYDQLDQELTSMRQALRDSSKDSG